MQVDALVLAAGVATVSLARQVGIEIPLVDSPGTLAWSHPAALRDLPVILAPEVHFSQRPDGRWVVGAEFGGGGEEPTEEVGRSLLQAAARYLPDLEGLELARTTRGRRPLAVDGHPVVGRAPGASGLFLSVTHSGISLAPALGRLLAEEVLDGSLHPLLDPFRPQRFA